MRSVCEVWLMRIMVRKSVKSRGNQTASKIMPSNIKSTLVNHVVQWVGNDGSGLDVQGLTVVCRGSFLVSGAWCVNIYFSNISEGFSVGDIAAVRIAVRLLVASSSLHVVHLLGVVRVQTSWDKRRVRVGWISMVVVDVNVTTTNFWVGGLVRRSLVISSFAKKISSKMTKKQMILYLRLNLPWNHDKFISAQ